MGQESTIRFGSTYTLPGRQKMKKELQTELDELVKEINSKSYILNKKYSAGFLDGYKNALEKHMKELDPAIEAPVVENAPKA